MSKLIYIETTIPSFYFNTRKDNANVARQRWTQKWWDESVPKQNVVTSYAVLQELERFLLPGAKTHQVPRHAASRAAVG